MWNKSKKGLYSHFTGPFLTAIWAGTWSFRWFNFSTLFWIEVSSSWSKKNHLLLEKNRNNICHTAKSLIPTREMRTSTHFMSVLSAFFFNRPSNCEKRYLHLQLFEMVLLSVNTVFKVLQQCLQSIKFFSELPYLLLGQSWKRH